MSGEEFIKEWRNSSNTIEANTSGSTGTPKTISLTKGMLRASAERSILHFGLKKGDRIHSCIAYDYIGGKMTAVRSEIADTYLTAETPSNSPDLKGKVIRKATGNDSSLNDNEILDKEIDLVSVVPSQMPWLISHIDKLPVVKQWLIGGSAIPTDIRRMIAESGIVAWESYGMTETGSHVALRRVTADSTLPFQLLEGITAESDNRGTLRLQVPDEADNMLTVQTNDLVEFTGNRSFLIKGRIDDVINTGGKKFHPAEAERQLEERIKIPFMFTSRRDEKWGEAIVLLTEAKNENEVTAISEIIAQTLPRWQQPKEIIRVEHIPVTKSGKRLRKKLS